MEYRNEPAIIPASDDKGHNAQIPIRIPPDWIRQIDSIVKYRKFPYCNRGDFIRDAILRHFAWLEKYNDIPNSIFSKIQSMLDLAEETRCQQGFEDVIKRLDERVTYFLEKGARNEAIKYVMRMLSYIDRMPEGHWRNTFSGTVRGKYEGLISTASIASLTDAQPPEEE